MKTSFITPLLLSLVAMMFAACAGPDFFNQEMRVPAEALVDADPQTANPAPAGNQLMVLTWSDPAFQTALSEIIEKEDAKTFEVADIRLASARVEAADPNAPESALYGIDSVVVFFKRPVDQSYIRMASLTETQVIGSFNDHLMQTTAESIHSLFLYKSAAEMEAFVYGNGAFLTNKELKFTYSWNTTISGERKK